MRTFGLLLAAGLCMAMRAMAAGAAPPADTSDQWPASWREDYRRFEDYIEARAAYWQPSMLAIRPDGEVDHGVMIHEERTQHLTLDIYQAGEVMFDLAVKKSTNIIKGRNIAPGIYAAALRSASSIGYQHRLSASWLDDLALDIRWTGCRFRQHEALGCHDPST